jgi:hypothetical protein
LWLDPEQNLPGSAHSDRLTLLHLTLLFAIGQVAWPGASLVRKMMTLCY